MKRLFCAFLAVILLIGGALPVFAAYNKREEIKVGLIEMRETLTVRVGQTRIITVLISPTNADNKELTWTSDNEEVAAVIDDGVIAGVSPGTAVITAESENGRKAYCTVTVPGSALDGIPLDTDSIDLPIYNNSGELLTAYELRTAVEKAVKKAKKGEIAVVSYKNKTKLSSASLRAAAYAAELGDREASLRFSTSDKSGAIQGQISINAVLAKDTGTEIKTGVYTSSDKIGELKSGLEEKYGRRLGVVSCAQQGGYGMKVEIAAKLNMEGMGMSRLYFYTYSPQGGTTVLENTGWWLDKNGYVHFCTDKGGTIIVADSALD